jgi:hypothetical protein
MPQPVPANVIILFSIHYVLKAEQLLKSANIVHDVVPVPREISSDCGMAIEYGQQDTEKITGIFQKAGIDIARIYEKNADGTYFLLDKPTR